MEDFGWHLLPDSHGDKNGKSEMSQVVVPASEQNPESPLSETETRPSESAVNSEIRPSKSCLETGLETKTYLDYHNAHDGVI